MTDSNAVVILVSLGGLILAIVAFLGVLKLTLMIRNRYYLRLMGEGSDPTNESIRGFFSELRDKCRRPPPEIQIPDVTLCE